MHQPNRQRIPKNARYLFVLVLVILYGLGWIVVSFDKPASLAASLERTGIYGRHTSVQTSAPPDQTTESWRVEILDVHDGDTVRIRSQEDNKVYKCRLIGIDAPELDGTTYALGKRARDLLRQEIANAPELWVSFDHERFDNYDRLLVYLWPARPTSDITLSINYQLVSQGFAESLRVKPNTTYANQLSEAERRAYEERLGLWSEGDFTKRHRYSSSRP